MVIFAVSTYLITLKFHQIYESTILPFGDPFTYSIGFFKIIDLYDAQGYFHTILRMITDHPNWYWLQNILVALLAPFLNKSMTSISFINYFIYFLASLSFYHLGIKYGINRKISIVGGLLPWIYPINFTFTTYASITVTGLDASFTASLYVSLALILIFLRDPTNIKYAIFFGIAAGFSLWGRGNSLPVLGLILFVPTLILLKESLKNKKIKINIFFSFLIFTFMAAFYYLNTYDAISSYYSNHLTFFTRHEWNYIDAKKWFFNIPGYLFWQKENSFLAIFFTLVSHAFNIYLSVIVLLYKKFSKEKILIITGVFIYFATYFINLILFTDPLFSLQNCILQYQPMLIGLSCSILGVIIYWCREKHEVLDSSIFNYINLNLLFIIFSLFLVYFFTKVQMPHELVNGRPEPRKVENFSLNIDDYLSNNGKVGFLWYGFYNSRIVNYYRVMNGAGKIKNNYYQDPIYMGKYFNNLWTSSDYSEENRRKVRIEIENHFENAQIIIVPEKLSYISKKRCAFCYFSDDFATYVKSDTFPKMVILEKIEDTPGKNILILKRERDLDSNLKQKYKFFSKDIFLENFK